MIIIFPVIIHVVTVTGGNLIVFIGDIVWETFRGRTRELRAAETILTIGVGFSLNNLIIGVKKRK
jgi:hypothetical protein